MRDAKELRSGKSSSSSILSSVGSDSALSHHPYYLLDREWSSLQKSSIKQRCSMENPCWNAFVPLPIKAQLEVFNDLVDCNSIPVYSREVLLKVESGEICLLDRERCQTQYTSTIPRALK